MPSTMKLDHTVINVHYEMDAAAKLFAGLGFTLTARGYHTLGSINHLMMFGTDYMELLGMPQGAAEPSRRDILNAPIGINGLVFKTDDADATFAHLQAVGMDVDPPRAFSRPVELPDGTSDAKFRTVTARADVFPAGRVYFCEHATPDLVWRPEWQSHANLVRRMPEIVVVSRDVDRDATRFGKLVGTEAEGGAITFDGSQVSVLSDDAYQARYGDLASALGERESMYGALVLETTDLDATSDLLEKAPAGIVLQRLSGSVIVRVPDFDTVLEFVG